MDAMSRLAAPSSWSLSFLIGFRLRKRSRMLTESANTGFISLNCKWRTAR